MSSPNSRTWYHLVTAQVVYQVNGQPEISSMHLNGIVTTNTVNLPAASLGKAQQAVQLHFHQRHEGVDLMVLDVVITNLTNLGHMTPQEFHAAHEGTTLKPKAEGPNLTVVGGTATLEDALADAGAKEDTAAGE